MPAVAKGEKVFLDFCMYVSYLMFTKKGDYALVYMTDREWVSHVQGYVGRVGELVDFVEFY